MGKENGKERKGEIQKAKKNNSKKRTESEKKMR